MLFNEGTNEGDTGPSATWLFEPLSAIAPEGRISFELTVQLASPGRSLVEGPTVLFWQAIEALIVSEEGDIGTRMLGPVRTAIRQPSCNDAGACAVAFKVDADMSAVDTPPTPNPENNARVYMGLTVVRMWSEGAMVQVLTNASAPQSAGTLGDPKAVGGLMFPYLPFPLEAATPAQLPGTDTPYDYASVVRSLLRQYNPANQPSEPAPSIASWPPSTPATSPSPYEYPQGTPVFKPTPTSSRTRDQQVQPSTGIQAPALVAFILVLAGLAGAVFWRIRRGTRRG